MSETKKPYPKVFNPTTEVKDGSPIIFLHAMLCSKEIWNGIPQLVADGTGRVVHVYDARCHGENAGVGDFSFDNLVKDLEQYMTKESIKKAILVGHSMGGKTAISLALKDPEKVEKVFIVDMYVRAVTDELVNRSIKFLRLWDEAVREVAKDTPVEKITSISIPEFYNKLEPNEQLPTEKEAYLASKFVYNETEDGKRYCVSYNTAALTEGLKQYVKEEKKDPTGKYTGPAYFLYGTQSPYEVHKEVEDIKKYFPNVVMIPFQDAPHHIFAKHPEEFVKTLVEKIDLPLS